MFKCEGEVAFFSAKRWDRRNRADIIKSATPCNDAYVVRSYRVSNPLHLTVLAAMSEDYTTAPQHLRFVLVSSVNFKAEDAVHHSILLPKKASYFNQALI